jgi:isoquinoline 1-oxidoreductase subunit alpha
MRVLKINGREATIEVPDDVPLLWVIREDLGMCGTKFGCVHLDGQPVRSCVTPVSAAAGKEITTIEGLSPDGTHPLQQAWVKENVPQCGYCQSGQIMQAAALLKDKPSPTDEEITAAMSGNLCRCGTYGRIRAAIKRAAGT